MGGRRRAQCTDLGEQRPCVLSGGPELAQRAAQERGSTHIPLRWVRKKPTEEGAPEKGLEVSLEVRTGHGSCQVLGSRLEDPQAGQQAGYEKVP